MNFSISHDFDIDAADFWKMFFSPDYEQELWKRLKMRTATVLERKDEPAAYHRTVRLEPEIDVPAWAASLVSSTGYIEHGVLHRHKNSMDIRIEPAVMKDRLHLTGAFKITPLGPGRCRREFVGDLKVNVMLIGGKMEKFMVERIREGYDTAAAMTREYIARHKTKA